MSNTKMPAAGEVEVPQRPRVGLRAGTRYYVIENDKLPEPRVLAEGIEVLIGDLGATFNVYERDDGATIFVRVEDEIHDARENEDD